jgi:hypothetical protein
LTWAVDAKGRAFRVISLTAVAVLLSCAFLRTQPWLAALATVGGTSAFPEAGETTGSTWTLVGSGCCW